MTSDNSCCQQSATVVTPQVLSTVVNGVRPSELVVNNHPSLVSNTCVMTPKSNTKRASFLSQWRYSFLCCFINYVMCWFDGDVHYSIDYKKLSYHRNSSNSKFSGEREMKGGGERKGKGGRGIPQMLILATALVTLQYYRHRTANTLLQWKERIEEYWSFHGKRSILDTGGGSRCRKHKFQCGIVFHEE